MGGGRLHARARPRARDGDAGARARRPERGRLRVPRRRDVRLDALPPDRRLDRRRRVRRDLREPARGNLAGSLPAGAQLPAAPNPDAIAHAPGRDPRRSTSRRSPTRSTPVFLVAAAVGVAAFALTWLLREVPLKTTAQAPDIGDGFHASHDDDRLREIERALSLLARREKRWELYERGAARAELDLAPPELWLLARLGERVPITERELVDELPSPPEARRAARGAPRAGHSSTPRRRHDRAHRRGPRGLRAHRRRPLRRPARAARRLGARRASRAAAS